jgi:hypothetical protein
MQGATGGGTAAGSDQMKVSKPHAIGLPALKNNSKARSSEELVENLSPLSFLVPNNVTCICTCIFCTDHETTPSPFTLHTLPSPFPRLFPFNLVYYPGPAPSASITDQANRITPTGRNFTGFLV